MSWNASHKSAWTAVLGLSVLTLVVAGCGNFSPTGADPAATAAAAAQGAPTVASQAATAAAGAATAAAAAQGAPTVASQAATAAAGAATAEAAAQSAQTAAAQIAPPPDDGELVQRAGVGIMLTSEGAEAAAASYFPIESIYVYATFAQFNSKWASSNPTVTLALTGFEEEAKTLYYRSDLLSGTQSMPTAWHDYALLAKQRATADPLARPYLILEQAPAVPLTATMAFTPTESGGSLEGLLANVNSDDISYLVLEGRPQDRDQADPNNAPATRQPYVLIVITRDAPADGEWLAAWCLDCRRGICTWVCR